MPDVELVVEVRRRLAEVTDHREVNAERGLDQGRDDLLDARLEPGSDDRTECFNFNPKNRSVGEQSDCAMSLYIPKANVNLNNAHGTTN